MSISGDQDFASRLDQEVEKKPQRYWSSSKDFMYYVCVCIKGNWVLNNGLEIHCAEIIECGTHQLGNLTILWEKIESVLMILFMKTSELLTEVTVILGDVF